MAENLIVTKEKIVERRVNSNFAIESGLFYGKGKDQLTQTDPVLNTEKQHVGGAVRAATTKWDNTDGYYEVWNKIEDKLKALKVFMSRNPKANENQFPADYYDLIDLMRLDITRRRIQDPDLTTMLTQEITNTNFSKSVNLNEFLPFIGTFEEMKFTGQNVPMLQQKTGATDSVTMKHYGLGHTRTLEDEIYNLDIFSLQKVNTAVVRAHTGLRNELSVGQIVSRAGNYSTNQTVSASTGGDSYYEDLYNTLDRAIVRLGGLLDPQTTQEIDLPKIVLLVRNRVVARNVNRVINGNLLRQGAGAVTNLEPLEIDEIWQYRGDVSYKGVDKVTYSGVAENKAYMFVPGEAGAPFWTLAKRQLTQETGRGSVLQLAREERAWYFVQTYYSQEFFGETDNLLAGSGFIVEIDLPDIES